ncbi:transcription initiation factor TFIID subunit 4, partial [Xenotaenia resolanae]
NTIILGGNAIATGQALGTSTTVQATTAVTQKAGPLGSTGVPATPTAITAETLENVKKCRNFLSTLIKLASNGKQSSETTASVKELVKKLLEGKMEPEDFTSRLYKELNSSPQPYLVPFLK